MPRKMSILLDCIPEEGLGIPHDITEVPEGSPLAIFRFFFVDIMLDSFITATNAYANVRLIRRWKPLDLPEFKAFLAIIIHLGIINYPSRRHIWSRGPSGSVFIRKIMSKDRFEQILKCWHYRNYSAYSEAEIIEGKALDPFWQVSEFCTLLSDQFNFFWNPVSDKTWILMSSVYRGKDAINVDATIQINLKNGISRYIH